METPLHSLALFQGPGSPALSPFRNVLIHNSGMIKICTHQMSRMSISQPGEVHDSSCVMTQKCRVRYTITHKEALWSVIVKGLPINVRPAPLISSFIFHEIISHHVTDQNSRWLNQWISNTICGTFSNSDFLGTAPLDITLIFVTSCRSTCLILSPPFLGGFSFPNA